MRIGDRQPPRAAESAKTQAPAKAQTPAQVKTLGSAAPKGSTVNNRAADSMVYSPTNASALTALAGGAYTGEVLPPAMNPPTDERLGKAIDTAYQNVYEGKKFPTGEERTELLKLATQMRAQGKTATDVEFALTSKLKMQRDGLDKTDDASLNKVLDNVFKEIYDKGGTPNRAEWFEKAKRMAASGKDGPTIQDALKQGIQLQKDGLNGTDPGTLQKMINAAYDQAIKDAQEKDPNFKDLSTPAQRAEWMSKAKEMVTDNRSPLTIMNAIKASASAQVQGLDNTSDATLQRLIGDAFAANDVKLDAGDAEFVKELFDKAKKMAKGNNAADIRDALTELVSLRKEGLSHTNDATLGKLVEDAFQKAYQRRPSADEAKEWLEKARNMARGGANGKAIRDGLNTAVEAKKNGMDKTDDASLLKLIDAKFAELYPDNKHKVTQREHDAWLDFARKMAAGGTDAMAIGDAIAQGLKDSLANL